MQTYLSLLMLNTRNQHSWSPYFKLNFDVVVFNDINASRVGVVIRNDLGEVMGSLSTRGP